MTTSGTYSASFQRNTIIENALRNLGVTEQGDIPSADQYSEASEVLNMMIKNWRGIGVIIPLLDWIVVPLHTSSVVLGSDGMDYECIRNHTSSADTQPITGASWAGYWFQLGTSTGGAWVTGTAYQSICNYDLDASITDISSGFIRVSSVQGQKPFDRPLRKITQQEYFDLGNKTVATVPSMIYFQRHGNQVKPQLFMYGYPNSSTDFTLNLSVERYPQDITAVNNNTDFPQEWEEAITLNLSKRLALQYGTEGQIIQNINNQAAESLSLARGMSENSGDVYF